MGKRFLTTKDLMDTYGQTKKEEKPFDSAAFDKFMENLCGFILVAIMLYGAFRFLGYVGSLLKGTPTPIIDQFPI